MNFFVSLVTFASQRTMLEDINDRYGAATSFVGGKWVLPKGLSPTNFEEIANEDLVAEGGRGRT